MMAVRRDQWLREPARRVDCLQRLVGRSPPMRKIRGLVGRLAKTESTAMVYGETGAGKELVGEAVHALSSRGLHPMIKVNCAALPEGLLESELFGHVRGAFTGAFSDRIGRFEAAQGSTLFLDEIGDCSPATQVRLLRVLESRSIERVGSNRGRRVDVRVISATNQESCGRGGQGEVPRRPLLSP